MTEPKQPKRLWRNYLLDAHYQLKFTAYLVAAGLLIAIMLGGFLLRGSRGLLEQAQEAVDARAAAAETSRELGNVALARELGQRSADPAFVAQLEARSREVDAAYEREKEAVVAQRALLGRQERRTG